MRLPRGALKLYLEVAEDNYAAIAFYRSFDFQQVGVRSSYYSRPGGANRGSGDAA